MWLPQTPYQPTNSKDEQKKKATGEYIQSERGWGGLSTYLHGLCVNMIFVWENTTEVKTSARLFFKRVDKCFALIKSTSLSATQNTPSSKVTQQTTRTPPPPRTQHSSWQRGCQSPGRLSSGPSSSSSSLCPYRPPGCSCPARGSPPPRPSAR